MYLFNFLAPGYTSLYLFWIRLILSSFNVYLLLAHCVLSLSLIFSFLLRYRVGYTKLLLLSPILLFFVSSFYLLFFSFFRLAYCFPMSLFTFSHLTLFVLFFLLLVTIFIWLSSPFIVCLGLNHLLFISFILSFVYSC